MCLNYWFLNTQTRFLTFNKTEIVFYSALRHMNGAVTIIILTNRYYDNIAWLVYVFIVT